MNASRDPVRRVFTAALLAVAVISTGRAADDVVKEDEPTEAVPEAPALRGPAVPFGGPFGGRVIVMPGLRLQLGGQGQLQVQENVIVPGAEAGAQAVEGGRKQPYLGVVAGPVAPAVRAQLDLPEGVGLSIDAVAAGSPAEKAGVKQFDVIRKFNDQVIISPEQLTTLVKVAGAGTRVPLTLLRGGREQVVEAVLEERAVAADGVAGFVPGMPGVVNLGPMIPPGAVEGLGPQVQADIERKVAEALARAGVAGVAGGMLPGFAPVMVPGVQGQVQAQVLTIGPNAQSATVVSDARGTVEIRAAGGKKTVTVKDPAGEEVYSGPLDTDDDLEQVPEDYRDWVDEVDGGRPAIQPLAPEADEPEPGSEPEAEPDPAEAAGPTI